MTDEKWFNSSVSTHTGSLSVIRTHIREFERRSFGLTQPGKKRTRLNEHFDTIIRKPFGNDNTLIPVGIVSKGYTPAK